MFHKCLLRICKLTHLGLELFCCWKVFTLIGIGWLGLSYFFLKAFSLWLYESLLITMWALVVCVFQEFVYFIYCGKVVYYPFNVSSICSDAFCFHFYYWRVLSFVFTSLFPGLSKVLSIFSKIQPFIAFKNTFPISLIPALYYLFLYVLGLNKFYYDFFRYKIRSLIWDLSPFPSQYCFRCSHKFWYVDIL